MTPIKRELPTNTPQQAARAQATRAGAGATEPVRAGHAAESLFTRDTANPGAVQPRPANPLQRPLSPNHETRAENAAPKLPAGVWAPRAQVFVDADRRLFFVSGGYSHNAWGTVGAGQCHELASHGFSGSNDAYSATFEGGLSVEVRGAQLCMRNERGGHSAMTRVGGDAAASILEALVCPLPPTRVCAFLARLDASPLGEAGSHLYVDCPKFHGSGEDMRAYVVSPAGIRRELDVENVSRYLDGGTTYISTDAGTFYFPSRLKKGAVPSFTLDGSENKFSLTRLNPKEHGDLIAWFQIDAHEEELDLPSLGEIEPGRQAAFAATAHVHRYDIEKFFAPGARGGPIRDVQEGAENGAPQITVRLGEDSSLCYTLKDDGLFVKEHSRNSHVWDSTGPLGRQITADHDSASRLYEAVLALPLGSDGLALRETFRDITGR